MLANDGGLVHLAHALHVPVMALYGPVSPEVYGPYPSSPGAISLYHEHLACRPCYQKFRYQSDCTGRECLKDLTPDDVYRQLETDGYLERLIKTIEHKSTVI